MYVVRVVTPFITFKNEPRQKAFCALALFYIRDKSYFRFWSH